MRFVDVLVRQGHPGPATPPYRDDAQKRADAVRFVRDEDIPWQVLVDDVDGTVHAKYGLLPDPTYLIGTDGRVSFYSFWTHVPTLRGAIDTLLALGGRGVIGEQRLPHPVAPLADGWRAIERGLPQSAADLDAVAPGSSAVLRAGALAAPVIRRWALTSEPWPRPPLAVVGAMAVAAVLAGLLVTRQSRMTG